MELGRGFVRGFADKFVQAGHGCEILVEVGIHSITFVVERRGSRRPGRSVGEHAVVGVLGGPEAEIGQGGETRGDELTEQIRHEAGKRHGDTWSDRETLLNADARHRTPGWRRGRCARLATPREPHAHGMPHGQAGRQRPPDCGKRCVSGRTRKPDALTSILKSRHEPPRMGPRGRVSPGGGRRRRRLQPPVGAARWRSMASRRSRFEQGFAR
jgi:hypothetical protein